jgi:hypothetical protein
LQLKGATMTVSEVTGKLFTREEANRTLPLVRLIVRDIVDLNTDLLSRRERLDQLTGGQRRKSPRENDPYADEIRQMKAEFVADEQTLRSFISELADLGVQLSDPAAGTVTFPAAGDARFRWRLGDADVQSESLNNTLNLYTPPEAFQDKDGLARESR